jgi:uncharacterized protein DUF1488
MAIEFPNLCRRYDATRRCVGFSGYDGAMEKSFFVEERAIWHLEMPAQKDEAELLKTFDRHREQICRVARRAYEKRRERFYTLTAADFS